jgi:hypothetical protein
MGKQFTDNPDKRAVREKWDTPVLRYLHEHHGARFRYMGLPGVDLIDVTLWKDMIDEVIAFEPPDNSESRRESIAQLRRNLKVLGIRGVAYYGSLEEVVILGRDYEGLEYSQTKVITLYNFDFCNEIASPIDTRERGKQVLRFEAIRRVLQDQAECYRRAGRPNYFVLMLTVRNQIDAKKISQFLKQGLLADAKEFRDACQKLNPLPRQGALIGSNLWALKAFLYNLLCQNFANPNLSAVFFPFVLYKGTRVRSTRGFIESPMLHSVVLCKFGAVEAQAPDVFPEAFLQKSSIVVQNGALKWKAQTGETQGSNEAPDPVAWLGNFGPSLLSGLAG